MYQEVTSGLCWHAIHPSNRNMLVQVITVITSSWQAVSLLLISTSCAKLILSMKQSAASIQANNQTKKPVSKSTFFQVITFLLSNLLCWIPPNISFVTFAFLPQYPLHPMFWIVIAGTPINSVVNPLMFIVLNIRGHMEEKRKRMTKEALQQENSWDAIPHPTTPTMLLTEEILNGETIVRFFHSLATFWGVPILVHKWFKLVFLCFVMTGNIHKWQRISTLFVPLWL